MKICNYSRNTTENIFTSKLSNLIISPTKISCIGLIPQFLSFCNSLTLKIFGEIGFIYVSHKSL